MASIDFKGTATGNAAGTATITAIYTSCGHYVKETSCVCSYNTTSPPVTATLTVAPPTATITIKFTGSKSSGDALSFSSQTTCSQNLGLFACVNSGTPDWTWSFEVSAAVNDDASKWKVTQTVESQRSKGNFKDSSGILHAFDTGVTSITCPPCDGPDSGFLQQTSGQKDIFYIDSPGEPMNLLPGETVDSFTKALNFTAHFCSTVVAGTCYTQQGFVKILVAPGATLDTANSAAGTGTTSTNF